MSRLIEIAPEVGHHGVEQSLYRYVIVIRYRDVPVYMPLMRCNECFQVVLSSEAAFIQQPEHFPRREGAGHVHAESPPGFFPDRKEPPVDSLLPLPGQGRRGDHTKIGFSLLFRHDVRSSVIDVPVLFRGLARFIVPSSRIAFVVTRSV